MRPWSLTTLGLVAAVLVPAPASADIWWCESADGEVYIGQQRQPGMRCRLEARGGAAPPRAVAPRQSAAPVATTLASTTATAAFATPAPAQGDRFVQYEGIIQEAARLFQLPAEFIRAVVKVESNFNPNVVSRTGAMGLMQLMPGTARAMGVVNPFDPRQNILGGARYLRVLANMFNGDLVLTIAAYNAGEGAVMRYRGIPPYDETRRYVQRVLHHYYAFRTGTGSVRDPR